MLHKIGIGIVGLGMIGKLHCRAVAEHPYLRLIGVADINEILARQVAASVGCEAFTDYRELLEQPDLEAVIICTPETDHFEPTIAALQAHKHALVEKPLATDVSQAEQVVLEAEKVGTLLMVGHILRFDPRYAQAHELVRDGAIGEVVHIWTRRNNPRSAALRTAGRTSLVYYLGVHDLDMMLWITGQKAQTVYAQATSRVNAELGVEDTVFAVLRLESDIIGSMEVSWAFPEHMEARIYGGMDVLGTRGSLHIDVYNQGLKLVNEARSSNLDTMHWPIIHNRLVGNIREEVSHFAECLLFGTQPIVTGRDGLAAVRLAQAVVYSLRSGTIVHVQG